MTHKERKKELERIKANHAIFRFYYENHPNIQPSPYSESIGPTIEFLLSELDRRDEALRFYTHPHNVCIVLNKEQNQILDMKELRQVLPGVVFKTDAPTETTKPVPYGTVAREALEEE